jgi:hypothetical protein
MPRDVNMNILEIRYSVPIGSKHIDNDSSNPLRRSFDKLLLDGQPLKSAALCFFDPCNESAFGDQIKWLGVFIHTIGDRILFFPGYASLAETCTASRGRVIGTTHNFPIDHVTLDRNRTDIHVTSPGSFAHLRGGITKDLGQGRISWFGMSVKEWSGLRPLAKKTTIVCSAPGSDALRRG